MLNRLTLLAIAASPLLAACGATYIEDSFVETLSPVATASAVTQTVDLTFAEHIGIIDTSLNQLSDAIVENDGSGDQILASLLESWEAIEDDIKTDFPESHFGFYEVITLAEISVERRRPADASKAWKLFIDVAASIQ